MKRPAASEIRGHDEDGEIDGAGRAASQAAAGAPPSGEGRRWHAHGWNRPLSWKLIDAIAPRLPRFVLLPLHHLTSFICFVCMPRERAAARRNLRRVTGLTGLTNLRLAYRLFYNFSRVMVSYAEMRARDTADFADRLSGADEASRAMESVLEEGRGAILLTMHIGHWDMGLRLLERFGRPVHVVMLSEEPAEVARFAHEARGGGHVIVHQMGSSALLAVELMAALRRGEIVAIQADRAVGDNVMSVPFFGAAIDLPTGPAQLAMATGAPILPAFVLLDEGRGYRVEILEPLRLERVRGRAWSAGPALAEAMRRVASVMESVVARHPDQWFNFFDVWPRSEQERPPLARLREILFHHHVEAGRLAVAVGVGLFVGMTPFYGLHTVIALALAWALRLNLTAAVLATQISNPLLAPFLIAASARLGELMGAGHTVTGSWWDPTRSGFLGDWLRGGLALGLALGAAGGLITYAIAKRLRKSKHA